MSTVQTKILKPKLRTSKATRKCISSMQSDEEIHFIALRSYMKMEERKHYMK